MWFGSLGQIRFNSLFAMNGKLFHMWNYFLKSELWTPANANSIKNLFIRSGLLTSDFYWWGHSLHCIQKIPMNQRRLNLVFSSKNGIWLWTIILDLKIFKRFPHKLDYTFPRNYQTLIKKLELEAQKKSVFRTMQTFLKV